MTAPPWTTAHPSLRAAWESAANPRELIAWAVRARVAPPRLVLAASALTSLVCFHVDNHDVAAGVVECLHDLATFALAGLRDVVDLRALAQAAKQTRAASWVRAPAANRTNFYAACTLELLVDLTRELRAHALAPSGHHRDAIEAAGHWAASLATTLEGHGADVPMGHRLHAPWLAAALRHVLTWDTSLSPGARAGWDLALESGATARVLGPLAAPEAVQLGPVADPRAVELLRAHPGFVATAAGWLYLAPVGADLAVGTQPALRLTTGE